MLEHVQDVVITVNLRPVSRIEIQEDEFIN